jgi:PhnB protein
MPRAKKASSKKVTTTKKTKKTAVKKVAAKRKSKKVSAIPKGYNSLTAYLIVDNAAKAITFYKKAFGAKELMRMEQPNGKVAHAELKMGDSRIMLADECPEMKAQAPAAFGGCAMGIHFYTKDVDAVLKTAVKLGAQLSRSAEDMFYGDRTAEVIDPFGHKWHIATHIEDVTPAKMRKRAAELFGKK